MKLHKTGHEMCEVITLFYCKVVQKMNFCRPNGVLVPEITELMENQEY
jgi:hypothetical protein